MPLRPTGIDWEEVLNCFEDRVFLVDRDLTVVYMNRAAEETLAMGSPVRPGLPLGDCLPWLMDYRNALLACRDEGRTYIISARPPGGELLHVSLSPYRASGSAGSRAEGVLVTFHPTGLESRDRERLAFETMNDIVARISHEIRTPLGGIRGAAQLLAASVEGAEKENAGVIVKEADRLQGILQELLDMARPAPPALVSLNVHEILEQALTVQAPVLSEHHITVTRQFDPSLPDVAGDPARLLQVFLNIIQNAVEAMPEGGALDIVTRPSSEYIQTSEGTTRHWVVVSFADSGQGISPDTLDKIFLPYFTKRPGGTGLGLAISKRIMLDQHGSLEAANRPGGGAVLTVSIPFSTPKQAREA